MSAPINYIEVVFPISLWQGFSYAIPDTIHLDIKCGQRILAPFGNSKRIGIISQINIQPPDNMKIRCIEEIIDTEPLIPEDLFKFLLRVSEYYLAPLGKTLFAAIPGEFQIQKKRMIHAFHTQTNHPSQYADILEYIRQNSPVSLQQLNNQFTVGIIITALAYLKRKKLISELPEFHPPGKSGQTIKRLILNPDAETLIHKNAKRQSEVLELLKNSTEEIFFHDLSPELKGAVKKLEEKNIILTETTDITLQQLWHGYIDKPKSIVLNDQQSAAFDAINTALDAGKYSGFLLQGVTGSGKTEVYIEAIKKVLSIGKSAIVLVPEITLTTHLASRFRSVFGEKVAIWHSGLTNAQRSKIWTNVYAGEISVIIGARSALFLPARNIGLIVVDEEHDSSFKQRDPDPRYHARDAALIRGALTNSIVVLGSATPSLESHYNSVIRKLKKLEITKRFSSALPPEINIIDMKRQIEEGLDINAPFSVPLLAKIEEKTDKGEQVLILQNRRGYSNIVLCSKCGWSPKCKNCDISMTYHKKANRVICHYCNHEQILPDNCPECGGSQFYFPGFGTQRAEHDLQAKFPHLSIERLDVDTARKKNYTRDLLQRFENKKIDVIIGTQMIAKGLDFHNVSLVGVLNADIGLYLPDFRARERVFQLLYQVAGRAGRGGIRGEVWIQTFNAEDATVQMAVQLNQEKFVNNEYSERNPLNYPPFSRMALITISNIHQSRAIEAASKTTDFMRKKAGKIQVLGPASAPISRIKNHYRYVCILKIRKDFDPNGTRLRNHIRQFMNTTLFQQITRQTKMTIDIDPIDVL